MHVNALKALKEPVKNWNSILVLILVKKLDKHTRRAWDRSSDNEYMPNFDCLINFINKQARSDEMEPNSLYSKSTRTHVQVANTLEPCSICQQNHSVLKSNKFLQSYVKERHGLVKNLELCINCLRKNYRVNQCKSNFTCKTCKQKHHSLLHFQCNTNVITTSNTVNESTKFGKYIANKNVTYVSI